MSCPKRAYKLKRYTSRQPLDKTLLVWGLNKRPGTLLLNMRNLKQLVASRGLSEAFRGYVCPPAVSVGFRMAVLGGRCDFQFPSWGLIWALKCLNVTSVSKEKLEVVFLFFAWNGHSEACKDHKWTRMTSVGFRKPFGNQQSTAQIAYWRMSWVLYCTMLVQGTHFEPDLQMENLWINRLKSVFYFKWTISSF